MEGKGENLPNNSHKKHITNNCSADVHMKVCMLNRIQTISIFELDFMQIEQDVVSWK